MFRIDSLKDVELVANLQNELCSVAIERNMLNHRSVDYRVFLIEVEMKNKGGNYFKNVVIKNYFEHLHFFAQMVVTSTSKFKHGVLPFCVPIYSHSLTPFHAKTGDGGVNVRLNENYRTVIDRACRFVGCDADELCAALVSLHMMNNVRVEIFSGHIEGAWYKTLRAIRNRKSWPIKAKGKE